MESLLDANRVPATVPADERTTTIELSRQLAVQRVYRGGALILGGALISTVTAVLFGAAGSSGLSLALGMGAMALAGTGLVELGRAATHLRKYGSKASLIGFVATAGLGLSTLIAAVSNWIGVTLGGDVSSPVIHWAMNGVYSLGVVVLLLVLRALILWAVDTSGEPRNDATGF